MKLDNIIPEAKSESKFGPSASRKVEMDVVT